MPTATVVKTWTDREFAYLAVRVAENDGEARNVEYIASVPLADLQGLTPGQQKARLVAAVKAVRDAQQATPPAAPSITGTVTL